MASELKVDKFTGVTTAGSIDVVGEGNSTTTNLQQGLSKCWARWDGSGTAANKDSFNIASFTDNSTGTYTQTFTNAFSNANFSIVTGVGEETAGGNRGIGIQNAPTTTTTPFYSFTFPSSGGTSANDVNLQCADWQGDLA